MAWQRDLWGDKDDKPIGKVTLETYTFRVMTPPEEAVSKKGEKYAAFIAKQLDAPYDTLRILAFENARHGANKAVVDAKLTITGRTVDDEKGKVFFASGIHAPGEKKERRGYDWKAEAIRQHGSLEKAKAANRRDIQRRLELGYVPIVEAIIPGEPELKSVHWERRDNCVKDGKFWKLKIEFLMDRKGPAYVTAALKRITNGIDLGIDMSPGPARITASWAPRYREWVNQEVAKLTGEPYEAKVVELFP